MVPLPTGVVIGGGVCVALYSAYSLFWWCEPAAPSYLGLTLHLLQLVCTKVCGFWCFCFQFDVVIYAMRFVVNASAETDAMS